MRNEIKENYYKDKQKEEEKKRRKESENYNLIEDEDSIDEYLNDNAQKRIFSKFFHHLDSEYIYMICPVKEVNVNNDELDYDNDSDSDSSSTTNKTKSEHSKSKYTNNTNKTKEKSNNYDQEKQKNMNIFENLNENKIKKFCPGKIILKEKTSNFIKWISSIFQTINDSNITDYANVIEINKL
jgi:hypothetical protein